MNIYLMLYYSTGSTIGIFLFLIFSNGIMSKIFEFFGSPHILIALATGISIIVLAYFSKRVLPQEIGYLPSAIPPFMMLIYESLLQKYKHHPFLNVWYWIAVVFVLALIVIPIHL